MKLVAQFITAIVATLLSAGSLACDAADADCVEVGKWDISLGLGVGVRTNPVEDGDDFPLFVIPQINYNGERFFIHNLDLGAVLWENENQQLNLLATPSYDQVFFDRWNPANFFTDTNALIATGTNKNGYTNEFVPEIDSETELVSPAFRDVSPRKLRNRRTGGLVGIEYQFSVDAFDVQFQYLSEFTGLHDGEEARLAIARHWMSGKHHVVGSLGAVWQSEEVINYYYGVTPPEADARGTYVAGAALSGVLRLDWNYELTKRWDLRLLASYRRLPDDISASPLVNDNKVITVFIGGVYHF